MSKWIFTLIQFLPLSLFATYAFWNGPPGPERWIAAFQLGALAALIQLLIVLPQRRPANRLILGANLYLLVGGLAAFAHQWWLLQFYGVLKESGVFGFMLLVGVISTFASPAGYVGVVSSLQNKARVYSWFLVGATFFALVVSIIFRGNRALAAVVPVISLAVYQRVLAHRLSLAGKMHNTALHTDAR